MMHTSSDSSSTCPSTPALSTEPQADDRRQNRTILVDSHCHLDLAQFDEDRTDILARAQENGIGCIINPGIDVAHSRKAIELAEAHSDIYAAVGVHPNSSNQVDEAALKALRTLAAHPKVVAIGEIGLDYYWDKVEPGQQKRAFCAQLELAAELGLPVIIHSRESNEDVANILRDWVHSAAFRASPLAARPYAGVLHAFSGDEDLAREAYTWNFVLSLGGPVTFKNARSLHALVPKLDPTRLMLETDAPFLTPHPYRGQRNEPAHVALVCARLAELFGSSVAEVAATTTRLAYRFFGLEDRLHYDRLDQF